MRKSVFNAKELLDEGGKIPREVLDQMKLQTYRWERHRKEVGLDTMTQKDRICNLEQQCGNLKLDVDHLHRLLRGLCGAVLALGLSQTIHLLSEMFK